MHYLNCKDQGKCTLEEKYSRQRKSIPGRGTACTKACVQGTLEELKPEKAGTERWR